jgi:hypothetical protein
MALQKTNISISLGLGINTKVDEKQLSGSLLDLQNGYVKRTGEISKRNGFDELSNLTFGGTAITSAIGLANFEDELLLQTNDRSYSYAKDSDKWSDKGSNTTTLISNAPVISNSFAQQGVDLAVNGQLVLYAWQDSRGGSRCSLNDLASGSSLINDTLLSSTGFRPRCFAVGQFFFIFYYNSSNTSLVVRRVNIAQPSVLLAEQVLFNNPSPTNPYFDVCLVGSTRMVVSYRNSVNQVAIAYVLQNGTVGGTLQGVPDPIVLSTEDPNQSIACVSGVAVGNADVFHVIWSNSGSGVKHIALFEDFTTYKATTVVSATIARNITGISNGTSLVIFAEVPGAGFMNYYVVKHTLTISSNTSATVTLQRAAGLASKAFLYNNTNYVMVAFQSSSGLQDTYFIISETGQVVAKILPQLAGGVVFENSVVPGVWFSGSEFLIAGMRKTRLVSGGTTTFTLTGVNKIGISFDVSSTGISSQLGKNLHISGGYVKMYDGSSIIEHNFHLYPETLTLTAGGGAIAAGTYRYIAIWEWIDSQGQIHRSQTSLPVSITLGGSNNVTVTVPTLRYTDKKDTRTAVIASIYRTANNGTLFYKVTSDSSPTYNTTTADTISFVDNLTDAQLISRQLLYTTGGVVDNSPAPACTVLKSSKNRLFAAGLENGSEIAFSKPFVEGEGVAFSDVFRKQVDTKGGKITALAELDEKLVIFKRSAIYILSGEGPTDAGSADDFRVQAVSSDVGCIEPETVVETPQGVMFKSDKGIWLLDRGLSTKYLGDRVEAYNYLNITSAIVVANLNQVRFTSVEGITLVYDYYYDLWYTFTTQLSVDATTWLSQYVYVKPDGKVMIENSAFDDNKSPIKTKLTTSWLSLAGLQNYQRTYMVTILGTYGGPHKLIASVAYDFKDSEYETFVIDLDELGYSTTYGEGTYGDGVYGTLTDSTYQFEMKLAKQKCQAIRITLRDSFGNSVPSQSFSISAVSVAVGIKQGNNKLPGSRRMKPR